MRFVQKEEGAWMIRFGRSHAKQPVETPAEPKQGSRSTSSEEESFSDAISDLPKHGEVDPRRMEAKFNSSVDHPRPTGLRHVSNKCNLL
jgi:hypothetical protein